MFDKKHLNDLQAKFNNLSDEELLNLLMLERRNYSTQAIETADEIAVRRRLEYTVPEFIDESKPEHVRYVNAGFILLCAGFDSFGVLSVVNL